MRRIYESKVTRPVPRKQEAWVRCSVDGCPAMLPLSATWAAEVLYTLTPKDEPHWLRMPTCSKQHADQLAREYPATESEPER